MSQSTLVTLPRLADSLPAASMVAPHNHPETDAAVSWQAIPIRQASVHPSSFHCGGMMSGKVKVTGKRTQISEDWTPSARDRDFAEGLGVDVGAQAGAFCDYHQAHGNLMANWSAAWRTWCRNEVKYGRAPGQRILPLLSVAASSDPTDAYGARGWAASLPDSRPGTMDDGSVVPCLHGFDAAATAREVCQAAGLPPTWRGSLAHIGEWLRVGLDPDAIVAAVRTARTPRTVGAWQFYDARVRQQAARAA